MSNQTTKVNELKGLITDILRLFVTRPQDIVVEATWQIDQHKMRILCHRTDKGRIIGQNGQTYFAIRDIVSAWTNTHGCVVELCPVQVGTEGQFESVDFKSKQNWDFDKVESVVTRIQDTCLRYPDLSELQTEGRDGKTTFTLHLSQSERHSQARQIEFALKQLLPAIGKAVGHHLEGFVVRDMDEAQGEQPTENVGRFTR